MFKAPKSPLFIFATALADKDSRSAVPFRQQTCFRTAANRTPNRVGVHLSGSTRINPQSNHRERVPYLPLSDG